VQCLREPILALRGEIPIFSPAPRAGKRLQGQAYETCLATMPSEPPLPIYGGQGYLSGMSVSDGLKVAGTTNGGVAMPLYEFACQDCGKQFALRLSLKERESGQVTCPGCGSTKVTPLISSVMVKTSKKS